MTAHGIGDLPLVSAKALQAGIDMDMVSEGFLGTLKQSLENKTISRTEIDRACRRILEAKYKLGLFTDPYKYCDENRSKTELFTPEHRALARKIAAESFVLLKNDNHTLPLKKTGNIAVIGPLANTRSNMPGTWSVAVDLSKPATLVEGMQALAGNSAKIVYAKGSHLMQDARYEERATLFGRSLERDKETKTDEQLLNEALKTARNADVIIAALGETSEMSGESSSRTELNISDVQQNLLKALLKTGKPVVLVLFTGRPLTLAWENENVPVLLNTWFGGTEAAYAIADVLFGDVNPSGKLTMSFPKNVGQIPLYYNHKNTGRPLEEGKWFEKFRSNYLDVDNEPLYPFGYGLSYTQFAYGDVSLSRKEIGDNQSLTATIAVSNTGNFAGKEVVQLYIRDLTGTITRPVKELKGFEKIELKVGESRQVSFEITPEQLKFYHPDLEYANEPGEFEVMIGGNSRDVKSARFTLINR
jgi:beta-glucosidase